MSVWHRLSIPNPKKSEFTAGHQRLTPVIRATQEAEIRRIMVRSPCTHKWKIPQHGISHVSRSGCRHTKDTKLPSGHVWKAFVTRK
jgi:hypothetical protein